MDDEAIRVPHDAFDKLTPEQVAAKDIPGLRLIDRGWVESDGAVLMRDSHGHWIAFYRLVYVRVHEA